MYYATLQELKRYAGLTTATEDALLTSFLRWSTRLIDAYKARRYDVRLATILHNAPLETRSSFGVYDRALAAASGLKKLILLDDLLEIVELLNGDGVELTADEYLLEPLEKTPYSVVTLRAGASWVADDNGDVAGAISVQGFWGCHPDYGNAFVDSLDTVRDNPLTANTTSLHVTDISGVTSDLDSPRFQAGQMLRIENEFVYVVAATAVVGNDDLLTIQRGYNGTTAAQHAQGTAIKIFRPDDNIAQACIRLAAWRYQQKDVDNFDKTYAVGTGVVSVPAALPADVRDLLGAKGKPNRKS